MVRETRSGPIGYQRRKKISRNDGFAEKPLLIDEPEISEKPKIMKQDLGQKPEVDQIEELIVVLKNKRKKKESKDKEEEHENEKEDSVHLEENRSHEPIIEEIKDPNLNEEIKNQEVLNQGEKERKIEIFVQKGDQDETKSEIISLDIIAKLLCGKPNQSWKEMNIVLLTPTFVTHSLIAAYNLVPSTHKNCVC
ncbi:unnamed protein product [Cochlearia groenlandica]